MNITLMKHLCGMSTQTLYDFLLRFLEEKKYTTISDEKEKEWIIAEGKDPLILCTHIDTIYENVPMRIYTDTAAEVMWSPDGLGADDRAGIYAIIDILLNTNFRPSIIFTNEEEMGCIGARKLLNAFPKCPFKNAKAIIQLDRQGYRDAVYYGCNNFLFEEWISSFGFFTATGTFSDISLLCPIWDLAGVNLSVGYFNEHSKAEYLRWNYLEDTIKKIKLMLERIKEIELPFEFVFDKNYINPLLFYCGICNSPIIDPKYGITDKADNVDFVICEKCYKNWY